MFSLFFQLFICSIVVICSTNYVQAAHISIDLKVQMLYAGHIGDFTVTYQMEKARQAVVEYFQSDFVLRVYVPFVEKVLPEMLQDLIQNAAANNITKVITAGSSLVQRAIELAPLYPQIQIVTLLSDEQRMVPVNVLPMRMLFYRSYFLAGFYCGLVSPSKVGVSISNPPSVQTYQHLNAFFMGARQSSPSVEVGYTIVDSSDAPLGAKASWDSFMSWGAKCLIDNQLNAIIAKEAAKSQMLVVGLGGDKRVMSGEQTATSIIPDFFNNFKNLISMFIDFHPDNPGFKPNGYPIVNLTGNATLQPTTLSKISPITAEEARINQIHQELAQKHTVFRGGKATVNATTFFLAPFGLKAPRSVRSTIRDKLNEIETKQSALFCGSDYSALNLPNGLALDPDECMSYDQIYDSSFMMISPELKLVAIWTEKNATKSEFWKLGSPFTLSLLVTVGMLMLFVIVMRVHVVVYREAKVYMIASTNALCTSLLGCLFVLGSVPAQVLFPTVITCMVTMWLTGTGFGLVMGSILARNVKILLWPSQGYSTLAKDHKDAFTLSNYELLFKFLTPVMLAEYMLLTFWSAIATPQPILRAAAYLPVGTQAVACASPFHPGIGIAWYALNAGLAVANIGVAYKARNIAILGPEAVRSGLTLLNSILITALSAIVAAVVRRMTVAMALILWSKVMLVLVIVIVNVGIKFWDVQIVGAKEPLDESHHRSTTSLSETLQDSMVSEVKYNNNKHAAPLPLPEFYSESSESSLSSAPSCSSSSSKPASVTHSIVVKPSPGNKYSIPNGSSILHASSLLANPALTTSTSTSSSNDSSLPSPRSSLPRSNHHHHSYNSKSTPTLRAPTAHSLSSTTNESNLSGESSDD